MASDIRAFEEPKAVKSQHEADVGEVSKRRNSSSRRSRNDDHHLRERSRYDQRSRHSDSHGDEAAKTKDGRAKILSVMPRLPPCHSNHRLEKLLAEVTS